MSVTEQEARREAAEDVKSAAAQAIAELEKWRFNGWSAWISYEDETWIVHYSVND